MKEIFNKIKNEDVLVVTSEIEKCDMFLGRKQKLVNSNGDVYDVIYAYEEIDGCINKIKITEYNAKHYQMDFTIIEIIQAEETSLNSDEFIKFRR